MDGVGGVGWGGGGEGCRSRGGRARPQPHPVAALASTHPRVLQLENALAPGHAAPLGGALDAGARALAQQPKQRRVDDDVDEAGQQVITCVMVFGCGRRRCPAQQRAAAAQLGAGGQRAPAHLGLGAAAPLWAAAWGRKVALWRPGVALRACTRWTAVGSSVHCIAGAGTVSMITGSPKYG